MKLQRFGPRGQEKPAVQWQGQWLDVSAFTPDFDEAFFGEDGIDRLEAWLPEKAASLPRVADGQRVGPPVARPSKIVCIGLNYRDHAAETGVPVPEEPVLFFKSTTAIAGPFDPLPLPPGAEKVDWEVELVVVIGRTARHVPESRALEHVAGYLLHNDYSERAFQLERGGQWVKGKSCDGFAPLGPFLAPRKDLGDAADLAMWLEVDGRRYQDSSTSQMVFGVAALVSYVSRFMTLLPGDLISTGTPAGVGLGLDPPVYLRPGDVVTCGIEGLGEMRQEIRPAEDLP